jgi:hypothetical protein
VTAVRRQTQFEHPSRDVRNSLRSSLAEPPADGDITRAILAVYVSGSANADWL